MLRLWRSVLANFINDTRRPHLALLAPKTLLSMFTSKVITLLVAVIAAARGQAVNQINGNRLAEKIFHDRRKLTAGNSNGGAGLSMDCGDRSTYDCQLYVQDYLETYINVNKSYNKILRPVVERSSVLDVRIVVTFVDLIDVNTVLGTMTSKVFIDYHWKDEFLHWDASLTDNDDFHVIPNDLIYVPDIIIYNSVNGFLENLDSIATFLTSDGNAWWSGRGMAITSCVFDVSDFPFDSQECEMDFSSWIFSLNNINISEVIVDVLPSFTNLAWKVDDVQSERELKALWGGAYIYTFGKYSVSLTRYYSHYMYTAILPAVVISCLVLSSLWMSVHATRLSMCITGLLTLTAIQWSVASELPISDSSNWLSRFLLTSIIFIALCCLQCYGSYIMRNRKHNDAVPDWVKVLIKISLCYGVSGPSLDNNGNDLSPSLMKEKDTDKKSLNPDPSIELENMSRHSLQKKNSMGISVHQSEEPVHDNRVPISELQYTWERGSRAFDRICRVLFPFLYVLYVSIQLGTRL